MNGNTFGTIFRITTWGESHGPALGAIVDGCPSGIPLSMDDFIADMARRQGGNSTFATPRKEKDQVHIESGIFQGLTTGTPIALRILNENTKSEDYAAYSEVPRPGHADFTTMAKQGHRDPRGGGRSSARETTARVAAAVIAKKILKHFGIEVCAYVARIEEKSVEIDLDFEELKRLSAANPLFLPLSIEASQEWLQLVDEAKANQDSLGGNIACLVRGMPAGVGEPIFDKLNALLAHALMSLPAAVACELGAGRQSSFQRGSTIRDPIGAESGKLKVLGKKHGGLLGGITTGENLFLSVDFHAPTSIPQEIESASFQTLQSEKVAVQGRHDSTPLPRAVPMVEAMVAITLVDALCRAGRVPEKLLP